MCVNFQLVQVDFAAPFLNLNHLNNKLYSILSNTNSAITFCESSFPLKSTIQFKLIFSYVKQNECDNARPQNNANSSQSLNSKKVKSSP